MPSKQVPVLEPSNVGVGGNGPVKLPLSSHCKVSENMRRLMLMHMINTIGLLKKEDEPHTEFMAALAMFEPFIAEHAPQMVVVLASEAGQSLRMRSNGTITRAELLRMIHDYESANQWRRPAN
jgi:hypothetical protein